MFVRVLWIAVGALVGVAGSYVAQNQIGRWWPAEESEPPEAAFLRRRPRLKKLPDLGENLLAADGEQHTSQLHRGRTVRGCEFAPIGSQSVHRGLDRVNVTSFWARRDEPALNAPARCGGSP